MEWNYFVVIANKEFSEQKQLGEKKQS